MMSIDELGNVTIAQVLQYHGLRANECPIHPSHELTAVSETYAICHSCGVEWDAFGLYFDLNTLETPQEENIQSEDSESGVTSPSAVIAVEPDEPVQPTVGITDDFVGWVRANREHIMDSPDFDGDAGNAIGFLTLKSNLCLLPWVTEDLTYTQMQKLEETWKRNLIRLPKDGRGIKRSGRIPVEIRRRRKYSPTMKVYTFHRRETLEMLEIEDRHFSNTSVHSA